VIRRPALAAALALAAGLGSPACRKGPSDVGSGMNIVWVSFDSVRGDHCSFNGYGRATTPNLDGLAARGIRFPRAVAQAPYTLPSYASMLASRYVGDLRIHVKRDEANPANITSLAPGPSASDVPVAEVLQRAGYRTAAFVEGWLAAETDFDRGWDLFRHAYESLRVKLPNVIDWIEKNRGDRFFVFVYSNDTHYPFASKHGLRHLYGRFPSTFAFTLDNILGVRDGKVHPSKDDIAGAMARYDEGLHWADADLAPLFTYLERSGLSRRTIVVFNSDHGEEFGEHGVISHGQTYYDGVIRTPLLIAAPGMPRPGRASSVLVQNIDIAPTLLDMIGVERPAVWKGQSLKPELTESGARLPERPAFSEGAWTYWIGSVMEGDRKFILVKPQERMLFDLHGDPDEKSNLAFSDPDGVRTLYHALLKHFGGSGEWLAQMESGQPPSYGTWMKELMGHYGLGEQNEVVRELRTLGYLH
jgi:arylsulfatase A-like enzyme